MKKTIITIATLAISLGVAAGASDELNSLKTVRDNFVAATVSNYSPSAEITESFIDCSDFGRANDVLLLQLYMSVHLPDAEVERLLSLFDNDHWSDIDYSDPTRGRWQPTLHITRLYALTKLYADPSSGWYRDARLKTTLHSAIGYWYRTMPKCPNWWHNDIGVPKKLTAVLLALRDELSDQEVAGGLKVLERSAFGRTGQNKVWLAGNNLMKGLLINDENLVIRARDEIAEEIYTTTGEGIQPDWSFHQHGPQIQFGNYGLAYAEGLSFWFRVLDGTPYAFSDEQYRILSNLMTDGICWSVWRGVMDASFCGRQVFINGGRGKALSLAVAAANMATLDRPESNLFADIANQNLQPDSYRNTLCGTRYYRRSDCGIYRTADWYASIRMHSRRTIGFEMTNRENTLANFSADGALMVMQHGGEYDDIFAIWDWLRVPGTTTFFDGRPIKSSDRRADKTNYSDWVGGVAAGDVLCTTMELQRDSLYALKSNFFFDDVVVALGAGIRSDNPDCKALTTAIDQTRLAGEVVVGTTSGNKTVFAPSTPIEESYGGNLKWIHHDNRGYVLLDDMKVVLSTAQQSGLWDAIDPFYHNRSDSGRVVKCYIDHNPASSNGSYAYAVVPCATVAETARFARKGSVDVLRNDDECQAVEHKGTVCALFHKAGTLVSKHAQIEVSAPLLTIISGKRVWVSSPAADVGSVVVTITRRGKVRQLQFELPTDANRLGQTLSQSIE